MNFTINKKTYFKAILAVLLVAVACTITIVFMGKAATNLSAVAEVFICFILGFCVYALIGLFAAFFRRHPVLVIDVNGIHDHTSSNTGEIRWHNVHRIEGFKKWSGKFMMIGITDPAPLLSQKSVNEKEAFEKKLQRNKDYVIIWLGQLKGDPDEIFEAVKQKWTEVTGRS